MLLGDIYKSCLDILAMMYQRVMMTLTGSWNHSVQSKIPFSRLGIQQT